MSAVTDGDTTCWGPEYHITEDSELRIRYGMYDGMYEGDDWEYIYDFDAENTAAFLAQLPVKDDLKHYRRITYCEGVRIISKYSGAGTV